MNKILSFLIIIILTYTGLSQSLTTSLNSLSSDIAKDYISPLISGYGADMDCGWIQKVPEATIASIHFSAGVVFMGSFIGNAAKHFSQSDNLLLTTDQANQLTAAYSNNQTLRQFLVQQLTTSPVPVIVSGATITGAWNDTVNFVVSPQTYVYNGKFYTLPGQKFNLGFGGILDNMNVFTMFAPQVTIGTVLGTDVTFRIVPKSLFAGSNLSNTYCYGIGILHNPLCYFKHPPLFDLAIGAFYQRLSIEDILRSNDLHFGLYAGKTLGPKLFNIALYGGVSYERTSVSLSYFFHNGNQTIPLSFTVPADNKFSGTIGLALKLTLINVNADFNFSKFSSVSAGLGVGL